MSPKGNSYAPNPNEYFYKHNDTCYKDNNCQSDLKCFDNPNAVECKYVFVIKASTSRLNLVVPLKVYDINGNKVDYNE